MVVKQRQSQKQNVNVNINLGEKKKKRKPRKRKTGKKEVKRQTQPLYAFNPPPIINFPPAFNQQPAVNLPPPPIPQKQYSVFPEGETATTLNLLSNVPVPLQVEGSPVKELLKPVKTTKKEKITVLSSEEFAPAGEAQPFAPVEEENVFRASTEPAPPPSFAQPAPSTFETVEGEPAGKQSELENAIKFILEFGEQPAVIPAQQPTLRQQELIANLGARFKKQKLKEQKAEQKAEKQRLKIEQLIPSLERGQLYAPSQLYLEPEEPPSPTASTISSLSGGLQLGSINPSFKDVFGLSKISQQTGALPPIIKSEQLGPSAQPLTSSGLTAYSQPPNFPPDYFFDEGASEKPKKKKGLASFLVGELPPPAPAPAKKKAGRPKGSKNKPKYDPQQSALAFPQPVVTAEAIPVELTAQGAVSLSAPLSQQPTAQFLGGSEKTFSLAPSAPAKAGETLERRRGGVGITPKEDAFLALPPAFGV